MHFKQGPVKWGIIGCGDVCEVKSGPAFSKVAGSSLAAVMRRDAAKAEDFAKRHNVAVFYTDATQLICDPNINAIYIATPPESHEKYAIEAMRAGKPVYIEKPVTLNSSSCQRMMNTSRELQMPASVAHYRRELALFKRVKELIATGGIGKIKLVLLNLFQAPKNTSPSENWRVNPTLSGGGPFYDLAPHQLDILFWIFGEPGSVQGYSINQGKRYHAPDVTTMTCVFQDNILFQGIWSFNVSPDHQRDSCSIIGESGSVEFPFFASFTKATVEIRQQGTLTHEEFTFPENIQQPMITEVVNFFQGRRSNPCSLDEALITMKMMERSFDGYEERP